jgi:hypothetical protein
MDELHSNQVFQPKAKGLPQGQLAAFLRNKVDWESDSIGLSDINRSSSAPPTQLGLPEKLKLESELNETSPSDPRLNPEYAAYYYQHSRLDPRLPPPLYTPGQSWQYWSIPSLKKNNYFKSDMGVQNNGLFMSGNIERIQSPYNMDYSIDQTNSSSLLPTNINDYPRVPMNSGFNFPQGTSDFTRRTRTPLNNEISLVGDDRNKNDNEFNVEEKNKSKLNEVSIIENTPPIRSTSTPPFQISNMNQMKNDGNLNNTLENYYDLDLNAKMKELSLNRQNDYDMNQNNQGNEIFDQKLYQNHIDYNTLGYNNLLDSEYSNLKNQQQNPMFNMNYIQHQNQYNSQNQDLYKKINMLNSPSLEYNDYNRTIQNSLKTNPNYSMQNPNLYYMQQQKNNNLNDYNINKLNSSSLNSPIKTLPGNAAMINENNLNLFEQSIGNLDNEELMILKARMKNNDFNQPQQMTSSSGLRGSNVPIGLSNNITGKKRRPISIHTELSSQMLSPSQNNGKIMNEPASAGLINKDPKASFLSGNINDLTQNTRSPLLEEFRNNKNKKFELNEIIGSIVEFSSDQYGSRFIQQKLEVATNDEKQMVFDEIYPKALQLMTDIFGNYVIQKFFEHGTQQQKEKLANQMKDNVLKLSLQMYGCRVVQKALEHVLIDQQSSLIKELDGNILKCIKDQNGNHVIQKAIERMPTEYIQFIIDSFNGKMTELATHPYGCRVIQRVFENCTEEQTRPLMAELHKNTISLIQDQYGNYVIQHILEKGNINDKNEIIKKVHGKFLQMSKHKFASNVVEKCVINGTKNDRQAFINEITQIKPDGSSSLLSMIKDQYANYVVQKMIEVGDSEQKEMLINHIKPHIQALKKYNYGKHLIQKIEPEIMKKK